MDVALGQAVKMFFGNSSLEMVYFEAVANSLDAGANEITIKISAKAYNNPESIKIEIEDNGVGFTDDRFDKFCKLFNVDDASHKGLGRLVYLCYFDHVDIKTSYEKINLREWSFTENFKKEDAKHTLVPETKSGTRLNMTGYTLTKLKKYEFVQPLYIRKRLLEEFYSLFFKMKKNNRSISIVVESSVDGKTERAQLTTNDIPQFDTVELDSSVSLIDKFYLDWSIRETPGETSLIAAVSVDNRTIKVDLISTENIPVGYSMVFLLYSSWFIGKVDSSRQALEISETEMQSILTIFRRKVAQVIEARIPQIKERNKETQKNLVNKFPHLSGYFHTESIGYVSRNDILKKAQEKFFKAQKDLLEATSLTEDQYEKSIELSARALTEYILFRQVTIEALKNTTKENSEAELHKLFATMKTQFVQDNLPNDLYKNNAWLLDDKYMTYETLLSDREMTDLLKSITGDEATASDNDRPDIALVFSNDPNTSVQFDVVIVELKKRGISLEENMKTVTQLEKRARKLMNFYRNKIQRIWYYGIIEFNEEVELALAGEYKELYSSGKMYYRETKVAIQKEPLITLPIGIFIWDIDAVVKDAEARNSAFLKLIKSKFVDLA